MGTVMAEQVQLEVEIKDAGVWFLRNQKAVVLRSRFRARRNVSFTPVDIRALSAAPDAAALLRDVAYGQACEHEVYWTSRLWC